MITGGKADTKLPSDSDGVVACLLPFLKTKTTSVTLTRSTGTVVELVPTVLTLSSTSYFTRKESSTEARTTTRTESSLTQTGGNKWVATSENDGGLTSAPTASATESAEASNSVADSSVVTSTVTSALTGVVTPESSQDKPLEPTDDGGIFISAASGTCAPLKTVLVTVVSTLTVTNTIAPGCTPM